MNWYSYDASDTVMSLSSAGLLTTDSGYQVNGTTVIDSSRNITGTTITGAQFKWNVDSSGHNYLGSDIYDGLVLHSRPGESIFYGSGETSSSVKAHRFYTGTTSNSALGNEVFSITAGGDVTHTGIITSTHSGNAKVIADSSFNLEVDRGTTSHHNNLLYRTNGSVQWRIWQSGTDNVLAVRNEVAGTNVLTFTDTDSSAGKVYATEGMIYPICKKQWAGGDAI